MAITGTVQLSDADFARLADFVRMQIGLDLRPEKKGLVESRLTKRLRALKLESFTSYIDRICAGTDAAEMDSLAEALTTNVTSFFRESHHFDTLRDLVDRELAARIQGGNTLRLWSAGCSRGAEPFSIAITLADALGAEGLDHVRILATDIDRAVLDQARQATYPEEEIAGLDSAQRTRFFECTAEPPSQADRFWRVAPHLQKIVQFNPLNLVGPWPITQPLDVIFCRNVAIYFDAQTQAQLWRRLIDQLRPGGHLFIGHSERLDQASRQRMTPTGVTSFQKTLPEQDKA